MNYDGPRSERRRYLVYGLLSGLLVEMGGVFGDVGDFYWVASALCWLIAIWSFVYWWKSA